MWYLVALFAILTVMLFSGKGGFLIAGYNTASKMEKLKYNETKLSRVTGAGTGVITILLAVFATFKGNPPSFVGWILAILFVITIALMLILTNTICKSQNMQAVEESSDERKRSRRILIFTTIFVVILFGASGVLLETGDIVFNVNDDALYIDGSYWADESIGYNDIQSITYSEDIDVGTRTNGFGSVKLLEGHFENSQFGNYIMYSYSKCKSYIVIQTSTTVFLINSESSSETEKLYKEIMSKL